MPVLNSYVCRTRQSIPNWNTLFKKGCVSAAAQISPHSTSIASWLVPSYPYWGTMFEFRPYITLFLSTKKFVAGQIKNIVVPAPITTAPHKIFIMSDEEGEHHHRTAARCHLADDTLPPPHCRQRQRCAATKLPPLPPLLTFYVSLLSSFSSPLPLPLFGDC